MPWLVLIGLFVAVTRCGGSRGAANNPFPPEWPGPHRLYATASVGPVPSTACEDAGGFTTVERQTWKELGSPGPGAFLYKDEATGKRYAGVSYASRLYGIPFVLSSAVCVFPEPK
jgi:hypothetical protein